MPRLAQEVEIRQGPIDRNISVELGGRVGLDSGILFIVGKE